MYSKLEGKIKTQNWETDIFKFLKGVFQGDPYSGVIFLITFKPIIEYIKKNKETQGYELKTEKSVKCVSTTPFTNDFDIISRNNTKHQQLVKDVETKLKSMGLVLKASKCRSLSITGGKTSNIHFTLNNSGSEVQILFVLEKNINFLGSEVTGYSSKSAMIASMKLKLKS